MDFGEGEAEGGGGDGDGVGGVEDELPLAAREEDADGGVGAEEGGEEDNAEGFEDPAGFDEGDHLGGRGAGGVGSLGVVAWDEAGGLGGGLRAGLAGILGHGSSARTQYLAWRAEGARGGSGSHVEELVEEAVETVEAGEVVEAGVADAARGAGGCAAVDAEEGGAAVEVVGAGEAGGLGGVEDGGEEGWMGARGLGLGVRRAVAGVDVGVGDEEGQDEEGRERFDDEAGAMEAAHAGMRRGLLRGGCRVGDGRHGWVRLGTASHGLVGCGAGCARKFN